MCEIPRGGKDGFVTFGLNNWKRGITLCRYWETERGTCWEENREFDSGDMNLNMLSRYPRGDVKLAVSYAILEFRGEFQARDSI